MSAQRFATWPGAVVLVTVLMAAGCREMPKEPPPPGTGPAARPEAPESARAPMPVATSPTNATRPAAPRYADEPPFRVDATVDSAGEPQAGWIRIEVFEDKQRPAHVDGLFPEANKIHVNTDNARELTLVLSRLPIQPNRRIILYIDRQAIEFSQRFRREDVRLSRGTTGHWSVIAPSPK